MSMMMLSDTHFQTVRKNISTTVVGGGVISEVFGNMWKNQVQLKIDLFVMFANEFNVEANCMAEQAKKGEEFTYDLEEWCKAMNNVKVKKVSIHQLLKLLECIDYNTCVKDYLTQREYDMWDAVRKAEYEDYRARLNKLISAIKDKIIHELPEYNDAYWAI